MLLLAVGISTAVAGCVDPSGASGPSMWSIGFGTDGSPCELTGTASTFPEGVPVHVLLTLNPPLPTGGTIAVDVERDGSVVPDLTQTVTVDEPAPCLYGELGLLEAGHYRVTFAIDPSQLPPAVGEFDVGPPL